MPQNGPILFMAFYDNKYEVQSALTRLYFMFKYENLVKEFAQIQYKHIKLNHQSYNCLKFRRCACNYIKKLLL